VDFLKKLIDPNSRLGATALALLGVLQTAGVVHIDPSKLSAWIAILGGLGMHGIHNSFDRAQKPALTAEAEAKPKP
jgi:hypothetical protein